MLYRIAHPELFELLSASERLLEATGWVVELCANYGVIEGASARDRLNRAVEVRACQVLCVSGLGPGGQMWGLMRSG